MFVSIEELTQAREQTLRTSNAILSTAFEGSRKLAELNVQTLRQSFEQNGELVRSMASATNPRAASDAVSNAASKAARLDESAMVDYVKQAFSISNETTMAIQSLIEKHMTSQQKRLVESLDAMTRHAPAGTGNVISLFKQGVANANAAYAQVNNQTRQLADLVEANVVGATKAASAPRKRAAAAVEAAA